jgi:hypothetical protein
MEMAPIDLDNAAPQRDFSTIPPDDYSAIMKVRPGAAGPDGTLTRSHKGDCEMLKYELIIDEGPHAKAHVFDQMVIRGTTDGHAKAAEISLSRLRALVESARGIHPNDRSPEARQARSLNSFADISGLRVMVRIGLEPERANPKDPSKPWPARNTVDRFLTPADIGWKQLPQTPTDFSPDVPSGTNGGGPSSGSAGGQLKLPDWAS